MKSKLRFAIWCVLITALVLYTGLRTGWAAPLPQNVVGVKVTPEKEKFILMGHEAEVRAVGFSPDGKLIASTDKEGVTKFWDVATFRERSRVTFSGLTLFSKDWRFTSAETEETIQVLDTESGKVLVTVPKKEKRFITLSPQAGLLAWTQKLGEKWVIKTLDVATGKDGRLFDGHRHKVQWMGFLSEELLLSKSDEQLILWDVSTATMKYCADVAGYEGKFVAPSPDGSLVALLKGDAVSIWDATTGRELLKLDTKLINQVGAMVTLPSLSFSPDSKLLITVSHDGTLAYVKLWNLSNGAYLGILKAGGSVFDMSVSPDGLRVAVAASTLNLFRSQPTSVAEVLGLWVLQQTSQQTAATLWDVTNPTKVYDLGGLQNGYRASMMCFSKDGKLVATAGSGNLIRLWDTATGQEVKALSGCEKGVASLAFSPDDKLLVAASENLLRVWNLDSKPVEP